MAEIGIDDSVLADLVGKVVVITGGANGIGSRTAHRLFHSGARLVVADLDVVKSQSLVESLKQETQERHQDLSYVHVDVSNYDSVLALFKHAVDAYGQVDMAIHCAGITEIGGWFVPGITLESVAKPPTSKVLDVNLQGTFYFAQVALAAMEHGRSGLREDNKSITLVSSVAGFKDSPGLFAYSASKHGVMGLMRSLRGYLPAAFNVRMNVICPWATDTNMFANVRDVWVKEKLPLNDPDDVARIILQCAVDSGIHGKAVYVAGGRGFDIEEGIDRLEPKWLGEKQAEDLARGQAVLGTGSSWTVRE